MGCKAEDQVLRETEGCGCNTGDSCDNYRCKFWFSEYKGRRWDDIAIDEGRIKS